MTDSQANGPAADFELLSHEEKKVSLKEFGGKKNVVLYFYPKDDTPGCTKEAQAFRDLYEEFQAQDTEVLGVSKDSIARHVKFRQKYDLPFPLLSDEEGVVVED
jgi:peroxiredoxin Q/BCP